MRTYCQSNGTTKIGDTQLSKRAKKNQLHYGFISKPKECDNL